MCTKTITASIATSITWWNQWFTGALVLATGLGLVGLDHYFVAVLWGCWVGFTPVLASIALVLTSRQEGKPGFVFNAVLLLMSGVALLRALAII